MNEARRALILITDQYPTDEAGDGCFIEDEIRYYAAVFDEVVILPKTLGRGARSLPENCSASPALAEEIGSLSRPSVRTICRYARALFSHEFVAEAWRAPGIRGLAKLTYYIAKARATERIISRMATGRGLDLGRTLVCTFWFDACTYGAARLGARVGATVTRAHGADLYEERHEGGFLPLRSRTLADIAAVACVSQAGADYLAARYPAFGGKISCFPLGMADAATDPISHANSGDAYIVSCSGLIPLKRVELIIEGLASLPPEDLHGITWVHFGDGPELRRLENLAQEKLPNGNFRFVGSLTREAIFKFYKTETIRLFVTTSSTEGRPMSIIEAQCFGIPVAATAVGGIPDLVNEMNGRLMPSDPTPSEVGAVVRTLLAHPHPEEMRKASRASWEAHSSAAKNSAAFSQFLVSLIAHEANKQD